MRKDDAPSIYAGNPRLLYRNFMHVAEHGLPPLLHVQAGAVPGSATSVGGPTYAVRTT